MVYTSTSAEQTRQIAAEIAGRFKKRGGVVALIGDLGAGKTTFAQGFSQALGISGRIISPTFILIRQYPIPNSDRILYHLDLYRLVEGDNLNELGLAEVLGSPKNIVLVEWAEKILDQLPRQTLKIRFEKVAATERRLMVD